MMMLSMFGELNLILLLVIFNFYDVPFLQNQSPHIRVLFLTPYSKIPQSSDTWFSNSKISKQKMLDFIKLYRLETILFWKGSLLFVGNRQIQTEM
jgi:hypothetical protein